MTFVEQNSGAAKARARAAIISVAEHLFRCGGIGAVTTRAIASEAGVQAPTIYRLFDDKDNLLDAVAERVFETYVEDKALPDDTGDPIADLRTGWDTHLEFGLANPEICALLADPKRITRSPSAATGLAILRGRVHRIATAGRLKVAEERAVEMIYAASIGVVLTLLTVAPEARDPGLADAMYETLKQAIITETPVAPAGNTVALAVALRADLLNVAVLGNAERAMFTEWLDRIINA
jgi:AcrR family transcriptional regulator